MAFFQGTLQEGIAAALQQTKSVVCFVTDGQDESQRWESEFLKEDDVVTLLQSTAVTLRLEAGSQEEGFLAQLYPIPKKPTIVVIRNADLKEYIPGGTPREEVRRRLFKSLGPLEPVVTQHAASPTSAPASVPAPAIVTAPTPAPVPAPVTPILPSPAELEGSIASSSGQATPSPASESRAQAQAMLADRAARLAEQKRKEDEEAKQKRQEVARARAEAATNGGATSQDKYAEMMKKKRKEAQEERARILKAIEDDKAARKAKAAEIAAERKALAEASTAPFAPATEILPKAGKLSEHAAIQVRLFDGSSLRSKFSSTDSLKDVRQYVDESRKDGKQPYTFKVLLTPLPSRRIDVTEEGKTLQELELAPSATLILVPVPKHTTAHTRTSSVASSAVHPPEGNIFQRFIAFILAIITGIFGGIASLFSTLFSTGTAPGEEQPDTQQADGRGQATGRADGRRVAGLDNVRRRNQQQFYNGNSTNFEPRREDEDEE
ncbi:UBX domain-containing protein 4 [Cladorrhinum sp. PSN332]|nr:UBX domain-containing protein 4 [Cladorrhinum sp. PSN332]